MIDGNNEMASSEPKIPSSSKKSQVEFEKQKEPESKQSSKMSELNPMMSNLSQPYISN